MIDMKKSLTHIACVFLFISCAKNDETTTVEREQLSGNEVAILTLGDSRVEGARPEYESYRYELWKNLVSASYAFNLIGPFEDNASYPAFMGADFDNEHAGIGGDTTSDVLARLDAALNSASRAPDLVVLGIGGNDVLQGVPVSTVVSNINTIIDRIQIVNPEVTVFLELISGVRSDVPNAASLNEMVTDFVDQLSIIATDQTTNTSKIIIVDMNTNILDSYYADDVHFNEIGAKAIADRYFEAIDSFLQ